MKLPCKCILCEQSIVDGEQHFVATMLEINPGEESKHYTTVDICNDCSAKLLGAFYHDTHELVEKETVTMEIAEVFD